MNGNAGVAGLEKSGKKIIITPRKKTQLSLLNSGPNKPTPKPNLCTHRSPLHRVFSPCPLYLESRRAGEAPGVDALLNRLVSEQLLILGSDKESARLSEMWRERRGLGNWGAGGVYGEQSSP